MAISLRLNTLRRTAVATTTRLPRYARNDKVGMIELTPQPGHTICSQPDYGYAIRQGRRKVMRSHFILSLRGA